MFLASHLCAASVVCFGRCTSGDRERVVEGVDRFLPRCRVENEANVLAPVLDLYAEFVPDASTPEEVDDDVTGLSMTEMVRRGQGYLTSTASLLPAEDSRPTIHSVSSRSTCRLATRVPPCGHRRRWRSADVLRLLAGPGAADGRPRDEWMDAGTSDPIVLEHGRPPHRGRHRIRRLVFCSAHP